MTADRDKLDIYPTALPLLLQVKRPGQEPEEFYIEEGLTIGRSRANTIVVLGDDQVTRFHASLGAITHRRYSLVAASPRSWITVGGKQVREVLLDVGVRFQIGATRCLCLAAPRSGNKPPPLEDYTSPEQCMLAGNEDGRSIPPLFGKARTQRVLYADEAGLGLQGVDQATGQPVRIEWLTKPAYSDSREANVLPQLALLRSQIKHRNLISLREVGIANDCLFLAWDWIDRPCLKDIIADYRELGSLPDFDDIVPWVSQIGSALAWLEAHRIVVGQIDDTRLLLDRHQQVVIVDCLLCWQFSRVAE